MICQPIVAPHRLGPLCKRGHDHAGTGMIPLDAWLAGATAAVVAEEQMIERGRRSMGEIP